MPGLRPGSHFPAENTAIRSPGAIIGHNHVEMQSQTSRLHEAARPFTSGHIRYEIARIIASTRASTATQTQRTETRSHRESIDEYTRYSGAVTEHTSTNSMSVIREHTLAHNRNSAAHYSYPGEITETMEDLVDYGYTLPASDQLDNSRDLYHALNAQAQGDNRRARRAGSRERTQTPEGARVTARRIRTAQHNHTTEHTTIAENNRTVPRSQADRIRRIDGDLCREMRR